MTVRVKWSIAIYAIVISVSVLLTLPVRANGPDQGSMNSDLKIPDSELQHVKLRALQGSAIDARRLVLNYSDNKHQNYWSQIGAENGNFIDELNYANFLRSQADPMDNVRAKFWFLRAKQQGYKYLSPDDVKFMNSKVTSLSVPLTVPVRANAHDQGSMDSAYKIPTSELQHVKLRALQGSAIDARRLTWNYSDGKHQNYWLQIAAENGDVIDEVNYANYLLMGDHMDRVRAKFWFLRAKQQGFKDFAPEELKIMNSK